MSFEVGFLFHSWALLALGLGVLFGSLANVLIYRIPRDLPIGVFTGGRSRCPHCNQQISWYDNIPLFSFCLLRGKCRSCGGPIPFRYVFIELLVPLILWMSMAVLLQANGARDQGEWLQLLWVLVELYFIYSLILIVFIDIDFRIIPDRFSLGNWAIAVSILFVFDHLNFVDSILGGVFGCGSFWLMAWGYEKFKGVEGLGFGDVKMMGWLGTWLGFVEVPALILMASASGLIVGIFAMRKGQDGMKTAIPFGPFLALGAWVVWVKIKLFTGL